MTETRVVITPRRSLGLLALLSLLMVAFSYVFALLLGAACVYLPYLMLVNIERAVGQVLVLFIAGIVLALTILWSLLPRWQKFQAPGMPIERREHPRFFAELDRIAATLKEPLPRHVYLVWGVEAFVADRGGILGFGNRRILGVGLPLFSILTVSELRAVLAHEFAHFYGGDTRLGPLVYKAQSAVGRTYRNVTNIHSAAKVLAFQVINGIASVILGWYFGLFLRVINFISRKREFRADEIACIVAGVVPMREGLKKIHAGSFPWMMYWGMEVQQLIQKGVLTPIGEGFEKFLSSPELAPEFEKAMLAELAESKTDPLDSHPSLGERIAAMEEQPKVVIRVDSTRAVELLENPLDVESKFVQTLDPKLREKTLSFVEWDELAEKVTIPEWKSLIATNRKVLEDMTTDSIPEQVKRVAEIGERIPDPPGELWSREQRTQRAMYLLSVAVGLRMLEQGWRIHWAPGDFHLYLGQERANVMEKLGALSRREMTADKWIEQCENWRIAGLSLASQTDQKPRAIVPRA